MKFRLQRERYLLPVFLIWLLLMVTAACTSQPAAIQPPETAATDSPAPSTASPADIPPLTWEQLKNATYQLPLEMGGPEDGQIPLTDNHFSYKPIPDSASEYRYFLYPGVAFGDLNGDGVDDAVVILINISPGSGNFYHLVPVLNVGGQPQPLNAGLIGDRVVVDDVEIADEEVQLTFKTYRPDEPYGSTPTLQVVRTYSLQNDELAQISEETLNAEDVVNDIEIRPVVTIELPDAGGSVSYTGQTGPFGLDEYALSATAGQVLTITVTAPHQDAFLSIFGLDSPGILVSAQDEQSSWQGTVAETQQYAINVFAIGTETEYTLLIETPGQEIATPSAAPAPGPEEEGKVVYLTFDDGPTPPYTSEILDVLAQYDAHATFFVLGVNGQQHSDLLAATGQAGHALANHTYSHTSLAGLSQADFNQEVKQTAEILGSGATSCLRPPYGATDAFTQAYAAELGYDVIMWNIDTLDWNRPGIEPIASTVMEHIYPGAIVLMHDGGGDRTQTVAALQNILRDLSSQGYVFEPLCQADNF